MKRRPATAFSLAFLDIMFCGFGAVVLLVLIMNHDIVNSREQTFTDLRSEVVALKQQLILDNSALSSALASLDRTNRELITTTMDSSGASTELDEIELGMAQLSAATFATRQHISALSADLRTLDKTKKRLDGSVIVPTTDPGDKIHDIKGQGDRQYVTGLKMGGRRILILLDASASMLDETIVNIIRRRNMSDSQKRDAPKWKRAVATVEWLVANLPANSDFQIYRFNTKAEAVSASSRGRWLAAAKGTDVEGVIDSLRSTIPSGGTSLYNAFAAAKTLSPRPDNILLVTDGLPTQGPGKAKRGNVTGKQRLAFFADAQYALPPAVPVNTILLPIEGDAHAAAAFWKLAIDTQGSFLTPARDWP